MYSCVFISLFKLEQNFKAKYYYDSKISNNFMFHIIYIKIWKPTKNGVKVFTLGFTLLQLSHFKLG